MLLGDLTLNPETVTSVPEQNLAEDQAARDEENALHTYGEPEEPTGADLETAVESEETAPQAEEQTETESASEAFTEPIEEEIEETIVLDETADDTNVMLLGDLTTDPETAVESEETTPEAEEQTETESVPEQDLAEDQAAWDEEIAPHPEGEPEAEEAVGEVPPVLWDTTADPLQPAIAAPTTEPQPAALEAPAEAAAAQVEETLDEETAVEEEQEETPVTEEHHDEVQVDSSKEPFAGNDDDTLHFDDDEDDVETTNVFDGLRDETVFLEDSFNSPTYTGQSYTGPSYDSMAADPLANQPSSLLEDDTIVVPQDDDAEISYAPARAAVDTHGWGRSDEAPVEETDDDEPAAQPSRACDKQDHRDDDMEDTREIRFDRAPARSSVTGMLSHSEEMNFWEFLAAEDEVREYGQLHDDSIDPSRPTE